MSKLLMSAAAVSLLMSASAMANHHGKMSPDANNDGTITRAEFMSQAEARFKMMDANNDGKLTEADRAAAQKMHFDKMDANKDGKLSMSEVKATRGEKAVKYFEKADANNDKYVTPAEMQNFMMSQKGDKKWGDKMHGEHRGK